MTVLRGFMVSDNGFWTRLSTEVRTAGERARGTARRAVQTGVLRIDLISLRRDRSRALADLGERTLAHWAGGAPEAIASDLEAIRLRERIASLDRDIQAKRAEIDRLSDAAREPAHAPEASSPVMTASNAS